MKTLKFFRLIPFMLLMALALSSCSGAIKTETREVSGFNAVSVSSFGELQVRQGEVESLTIEAPSDYLRYLETSVVNNSLNISTRRGFFGAPVRRVIYNLTVRDLNSLTFSGAGSIKILDGLKSGDFKLNLSGAGSIEINALIANSLTVNFSSAGAIIVAGKVDKQSVTMSGVGSYEAGDLDSNSASVVLTGAGSAVVWVHDHLDVTVSGVGSVGYFGSPQVSQNISGLGSVNSKGEHR
jgi:hypothetical protein